MCLPPPSRGLESSPHQLRSDTARTAATTRRNSWVAALARPGCGVEDTIPEDAAVVVDTKDA